MLQFFFICLVVLLALVGLAELFKNLICWIYRLWDPQQFYMVVPIKGHDESAEYVLRSAVNFARWNRMNNSIIVVNNHMDEDTLKICRELCADMEEVTICTPEQAQEIFSAVDLSRT